MKHEINLNNIDIHTDLAIDVIDKISSLDGVKQVIKNIDGVGITDVKLDKKNSLNKKEGNYITIEFDDVTDTTNYNKVKEVVKMELSSLLSWFTSGIRTHTISLKYIVLLVPIGAFIYCIVKIFKGISTKFPMSK